MNKILTSLFVGLVFALSTSAAQANLMLDYQGNNFTDITLQGPSTPMDQITTSDSVSGWLELSSMLAPNLDTQLVNPLSFSFSDGVATIDDATAVIAQFYFSTDVNGNITAWDVSLTSSDDITGGGFFNQINSVNGIFITDTEIKDFGEELLCDPSSTQYECKIGGSPSYYQYGDVVDNPGTWSYKAVPEPTTLALLSIGLAGLGISKRKMKA